MNNFTSALKGKHFRKKPIVIPISDLSQKSKDKRLSQTKLQTQTSQRRHKIFCLRQQISDCPAIVTARKRQEYCGYKQLSFDKSRFRRFLSIKRERPFRYPAKKYEANLKNIMKLKKRFSLEPSYYKSQQRGDFTSSRSTEFRLKQQNSMKSDQYNQQNKLRELMRNILFKEKPQKRFPTLYSKQPSGFSSQRLTEQKKDIEFKRYKSQFQQTARSVQKDYTFQRGLYISLQKLDRFKQESSKRGRMFFKIKQTNQQSSKNNENQRQLCGWQSKTVYGKIQNFSYRNNGLIRKSQLTQ